MEERKIARLRTVKQCLSEVKKIDPFTALSEWFLRTLCKDNKVKHFMTGTKILCNLDDLFRYLSFEFAESS